MEDQQGKVEYVKKKLLEGREGEDGASVLQVKKIQFEVSRLYHVATEAEIRARTKLQRIGKMQLKGLPSVELPSESGAGCEQAYIFKHPDGHVREGHLKVVLESDMQAEFLKPEGQLWPQQAEKAWQATPL